jgi:hypothetical protein
MSKLTLKGDSYAITVSNNGVYVQFLDDATQLELFEDHSIPDSEIKLEFGSVIIRDLSPYERDLLLTEKVLSLAAERVRDEFTSLSVSSRNWKDREEGEDVAERRSFFRKLSWNTDR